MKRLAIVLSAALMIVVLASTQVALASGEYVPFVTDFPKPAASTEAAEPFVPFVTDFPKSAATPAVTASIGGIDWGDVGTGSAAGAALAALLASVGLVLTRRARPARH